MTASASALGPALGALGDVLGRATWRAQKGGAVGAGG
jgi:hypothetical protein